MDLDALREDLKYWDDWTGDDWPLGNLSDVLAAARAVLDSEEAEVCTAHEGGIKTIGLTDKRCHRRFGSVVPCVMEPVLVVRVRLLAEEGT